MQNNDIPMFSWAVRFVNFLTADKRDNIISFTYQNFLDA